MQSAAQGEHSAHGMQAGLVAPDLPPLQPAEIEALAVHFPQLGAPVRILWHSPRPFSAAARISARGGEFFLKRHDARVRNVASLLEEHSFVSHLRAKAMTVPDISIAASGATAVASGGWTYELHAPVAGVDAYRDAHSWTPVGSIAHARSMGRALAHLHLASRGYAAAPRAQRPLMAGFDIIGEQDPAAALQRFVVRRPALERFLGQQDPAWRDAILQAIEPLHAQLRPLLPSLAPLWIHNDWHASNLFWTDRSLDAQVRAVIDFGLCNRGCAMQDLATALERNTIAWLEQPDPLHGAPADGAGSIGRPALAQALVEGYCEMRGLDAAERQALPLLLPLAHVEYALSEADYFHDVTGNDANAQLAYPKFLLGHLRWFAGRHGREYLDGLRQCLRRGLA